MFANQSEHTKSIIKKYKLPEDKPSMVTDHTNFICSKCGQKVSLQAPGTKNRNHCPFCLYSLHVDIEIGDRQGQCKGLMQPVARTLKKDGEEVLIHKCLKCGQIRKNRIAGDDSFEGVESLSVVDFNSIE